MSIGISDLAEHTGLSEATISRVLNDREGVAESTRQAVLTAIDVLGYERPSKLRATTDRLVGVVMPHFDNPIFPKFATAVGGNLTQRGFTPIVGASESGGPSEAAYVRAMLERRISGVIFVSGVHSVDHQDHSHYEELIERGMPVVAIDGLAPDLDIPCVSTDDAEAVRLAARHLTHLGHRRLGLAIADEGHIPGQRKQKALVAFVEQNEGVSAELDRSMYSLEGGEASARHLIESGVTGIICASDIMALGAIRAATKMDLRVPEDISVIGFDDSSFMALVTPPLTTIRQPVPALSRAATELLTAQITGRDGRTGELMFDPELIVRDSTGPAPGVHA